MIYQSTIYFNKNVFFEGVLEQKRNKDRTFQTESAVLYTIISLCSYAGSSSLGASAVTTGPPFLITI